jgi:F0F1-type ATP synthase assembly protein I
MDSRKFVFTETAIIFAGELICSAAMVGIFALLDSFDRTVLLGAVVGTLAATLNFLFMAIVASLAADKAQQQNVKGGQAMIQSSYFLRMIVLFVVFFAFAKSGLCNPLAMALPLLLFRPILMVIEFLRKPGEKE